MYESYWGLKEKPFENAPDSRFFYNSQESREALARMLYIIKEKKDVGLLTGGYGIGKTLMAKILFDSMQGERERYAPVFISNPSMLPLDFLSEIVFCLGGKINKEDRKSDIIHNLNNILYQNAQDNRHTVLIIDDAQSIQDEGVFEELRFLLNLKFNLRSLISCIIVGATEIEERLRTIAGGFLQRIAITYHLYGLNQKDTTNYIHYRCRVAGGEKPIFEDDACQSIYSTSRGIPRIINNICDLCLIMGAGENATLIDRKITQKVTKDLFAEQRESPPQEPLRMSDVIRQVFTPQREIPEAESPRIEIEKISLRFPGQRPLPTQEPEKISEEFPVPHPEEIEEERSKNLYTQGISLAREVFAKVEKDEKIDGQAVFSWVVDLVNQMTMNDQELITLTTQISLEDWFLFHMVNVCILAIKLGLSINYEKDKLIALGLGAFLHDIGLIKTEEFIRSPNLLSKEEYEIIKAHPLKGEEIIKKIDGISESLRNEVLPIISRHHERLNGQGYPQGLKGDGIGELAQIIGLAEFYESTTHPRPYREMRAPSIIIREVIEQKKQNLFEAKLVKALVEEVGIYPLGSWVRLNTSEIARVTGVNKELPLRPLVDVTLDPSGQRIKEKRRLNLSEHRELYVAESLDYREIEKLQK